jgi:UDP-glucose 4-epimerase
MAMDNQYLYELIREVKRRPGGLLLSVAGNSEAVVLTIDRYNQLMQQITQLNTATKTAPAVKAAGQFMTILVTGGAGYIGSHTVRQLITAGHTVIVADNLSAGRRANVPPAAAFCEGDIGDEAFLDTIFTTYPIDVVMHFAASIEVEESVRDPEKYLANNTMATISLLRAMDRHGVRNIIFSSTAAVYGEPEKTPISEDAVLAPINPYGHSKLLAEQAIQFFAAYRGFTAVVFRYFNACGSDFDGALFDSHISHLIPIVMEVVEGKRPHLTVFGNDYDTMDGTCIRDYVHVLDIAGAHLAALPKMATLPSFSVYNIGSSRGASVEQIVQTATEVTGRMIPLEMGPRRDGDPAVLVADNRKIKAELGFELRFSDLPTIIKTSMRQ